jgi:hypothetical protein
MTRKRAVAVAANGAACPVQRRSIPNVDRFHWPIPKAPRHPGDRALTGCASLRSSTRDGRCPLPLPGAGREPASATPGVPRTPRRSCHPPIVSLMEARFVFARVRPPCDFGGVNAANWAYLPIPSRPLPLRVRECGGWRGEAKTDEVPWRDFPPLSALAKKNLPAFPMRNTTIAISDT